MILFIDTTKNQRVELALYNGNKKIGEKQFQAPFRQAEKLLPAITALLNKHRLELRDIKKIKVANQGGTFTSLRIGIITANALAYALGADIEGVAGQTRRIGDIKIVTPRYNQEPNITNRVT